MVVKIQKKKKEIQTAGPAVLTEPQMHCVICLRMELARQEERITLSKQFMSKLRKLCFISRHLKGKLEAVLKQKTYWLALGNTEATVVSLTLVKIKANHGKKRITIMIIIK